MPAQATDHYDGLAVAKIIEIIVKKSLETRPPGSLLDGFDNPERWLQFKSALTTLVKLADTELAAYIENPLDPAAVANPNKEVETQLYRYIENSIDSRYRATLTANHNDPLSLYKSLEKLNNLASADKRAAARAQSSLLQVQAQKAQWQLKDWPTLSREMTHIRDTLSDGDKHYTSLGSGLLDVFLGFANCKDLERLCEELSADISSGKPVSFETTVNNFHGRYIKKVKTTRATPSYHASAQDRPHGPPPYQQNHGHTGAKERPACLGCGKTNHRSVDCRKVPAAQQPCRKHAEGLCRFGEKCKFNHGTPATTDHRPRPPAANNSHMAVPPTENYAFHSAVDDHYAAEDTVDRHHIHPAPSAQGVAPVELQPPFDTTKDHGKMRLLVSPPVFFSYLSALLAVYFAYYLVASVPRASSQRLHTRQPELPPPSDIKPPPVATCTPVPPGPLRLFDTASTLVDVAKPRGPATSFATATRAITKFNWIYDTGTATSITYDPEDIPLPLAPNGASVITGGGNVTVDALGSIDIAKDLPVRGMLCTTMPVKLAGGADIDDLGFAAVTQNGTTTIYGGNLPPPKLPVVAVFVRNASRLYELVENTAGTVTHSFLAQTYVGDLTTPDLWHRRLHVSNADIKKHVISDSCRKACTFGFCEHCVLAKITRALKSGLGRDLPTHCGTHFNYDLLGARHGVDMSPEGYCTAALFYDAKSRYGFLVPLRNKDGASIVNAIRQLQAHLAALPSKKHRPLTQLFSDSEPVLKRGEVRDYCVANTIDQAFSPRDRHDKNCFSERYVRTIKELARAFSVAGGAPPQTGYHAYMQAVYVRNNVPTISNANKSAHYRLTKHSSERNVASIRTMFCTAYAKVMDGSQHELEPKAVKCVHLGNSWDTPGSYRLLNLTTKNIIDTPDCVFNETEFPYTTSTTAEQKARVLAWKWDDDLLTKLAAATELEDDESKLQPQPPVPDPKPLPEAAKPAPRPPGQQQRRSPRLAQHPAAGPAPDPHVGIYPVPGHQQPPPGQTDPSKYGRKSKRPWQPSEKSKENIVPSIGGGHGAHLAYNDANTVADIAAYCFSTFCSNATSSSSATTDWGWADKPSDNAHALAQKFACNVAWGNEPTPRSFDAAMKSQRSKRWRAATDKEMSSHDTRHTWDLAPRSEARAAGIPVIPAIWVLKDKMLANGDIQEKARVVAGGNRQKSDSSVETHAATAQLTSLRVMLSIAAAENLPLRNGDFSVAFLNAPAQEVVYMEQPRGYYRKDPRLWVCKLNLGLYGTRTANRGWSQVLHEALTEFGLTRSSADHGLYFSRHEGKPVFLFTHVDDLVWAGDLAQWDLLVKFLQGRFEFTDLGELTWVLGMRVTRDLSTHTISLNQERFTQKMAERFGITADTRIVPTPADPRINLTRAMDAYLQEDIEYMRTRAYRELIGSLLYLTMCTRPDMAEAVSTLCRFQQNPGRQHWLAAQRALKYALHTAHLGLTFGGHENTPTFELIGFADADWAGDVDSRRSTSGYIFLLYGCIISYKSALQHCVSLSTCEAEYVAAAEAAREAIWLTNLIAEISVKVLPVPITLNEDNEGAIALAKNPVGHGRNKHIQLRHHFLRELVNTGKIVMTKIPTESQLADIFTKSLGTKRFLFLRKLLLGA